ncbi:MAG: Mini-ribonuclease 3 [Clostridiales bacterium]|nr:Mini-ribonuclease 3 [Clostridiales bacterium]
MFDLDCYDEKDCKNLNPQVLAFVGDGVYSLYIRHRVLLDENSKGRKLHARVTDFVKAKGQSDFIEKLLPLFTEDELSIYKRARNHKTLSQAKNANIVDYKRATGLEAVIGYLYLTKNFDRLNEILKLSIGENNEN